MEGIMFNLLIAVVGAVVGVYGSWLVENRKYKLAARQLIVEKRVDALQHIYNFIQVLIKVSSLEMDKVSHESVVYYPDLLSNQDFLRFDEEINIVLRNHFWYSIALKNKIIDLTNLVEKYRGVITQVQSLEERKIMGREFVIKIDKIQGELQELIYCELNDISKFDDFIKDNIGAIRKH